MRQKYRLLQDTHQMRAKQCAKRSTDKDDHPVLRADAVPGASSQILVISVTGKISQRFADKMGRNAGFANGYGHGEVQGLFCG